MSDGKMVNIGSKENPIWLSEKALRPNTPEGQEWWGMVAEGSVVLQPEELDRLLEKNGGKKG